MTPVQRTLAALRQLGRLHHDTGLIPVFELDLLIAELATEAEDERPTAMPAPWQPPALDTNVYGYPRGLKSS